MATISMSGLFIIAGITLVLAIFAVLKIPHLTGDVTLTLLSPDAVNAFVFFDISILRPHLSIHNHPAGELYQIRPGVNSPRCTSITLQPPLGRLSVSLTM
jgi:hypothetical protein